MNELLTEPTVDISVPSSVAHKLATAGDLTLADMASIMAGAYNALAEGARTITADAEVVDDEIECPGGMTWDDVDTYEDLGRRVRDGLRRRFAALLAVDLPDVGFLDDAGDLWEYHADRGTWHYTNPAGLVCGLGRIDVDDIARAWGPMTPVILDDELEDDVAYVIDRTCSVFEVDPTDPDALYCVVHDDWCTAPYGRADRELSYGPVVALELEVAS